MDGFFGYNQIDILPTDQHKTTFIFPWGNFTYRNLPFILKNVGATFQRSISYVFHDIKHIVEPYLDDLPAHSQWREDHLGHLRYIFLRYHHYSIWLNPHKCVFCIEMGWLLGLVVSKDGIQIDPLKISAILALLAPTNLLELQILQGKENFLHHFVCNFAEKTYGYMRLLKKDTRFFWDDQAQRAFDNLKHTLNHSTMIHPPYYSKDFSYTLLPPLLPSLWFWCRRIPTVRSTWSTMLVRISWILKLDTHAWRN